MSISISSVFFLFLIFTTFASSTSSFNNNFHKCPKKQSEALLLFKHNLSSINHPNDDCSDSYPIMMSWNASTDCCSDWDGVLCDDSTGFRELYLASVSTKNANHYVNPGFRELYLASCKLKVFPNSLRSMKQLQWLDLSSNEIHGQIPHWAGEIGIGGTYGLGYMNLSHNFITGLPQFQWYGLEKLYLQSNLIEGPFPPSICNMSYLSYLDMSNNSFGGLIPQCFGNISSSLTMIDMRNNSFQGTIPNVYGDCRSLEGLILNGNQLRGEVPISLSKCQQLKVVDFGNNHMNRFAI